jgi:hypothetical protein
MSMSSLLLSLAACGGLDASLSDVVSVTVEPDELALTTREGEPGTATFSATAEMKDGTRLPLELVSWSSSNLSAGSIDADGQFTSVDTNGGITTVEANHLGITAEATVTVVYAANVFEDGLDESVAAAFEAADAADDDELSISYPPDGVTVPRNLTGLAFRWEDDAGASAYRIRFRSDITDVSVYLAGARWEASSALWEVISASNKRGTVSVSVEAGQWDGDTLSDVRGGPALEMTVNRLDARGSVLYWETAGESIMRIPFGATEAEVFWSSEDAGGRCSGCHTLIESPDSDEDIMVVTHDGVDGRFSVVDVSDPDDPTLIVEPTDNNRLTFQAASPDNRFLIGTNGPVATIYEARSGHPIQSFTFDAPVTHPNWSPDNDAILIVQIVEEIDGQRYSVRSDMDFERGALVELAWDPDAQELGAATVLKAASPDTNFYYPAYSPDGQWIAYNRSAIGAYASEDAEVWLMSRDGSIDLPLGAANSTGDLQNSYPRWGPLPDDEILWLAFSSKRTYPDADGGDGPRNLPQIWVAAINPELALEGNDPSSAPFWLPGQDTRSDNHLPIWWSQ